MLSKALENILGDFILPILDQYIDPGQCGGLKLSSISHYLVKLLDFIHSTLDQRTPHCAVLAVEDLIKAYNRGSHQLVIEDLYNMHVPGWILNILCSYLMVLTYQKSPRTPPRRQSPPRGPYLGALVLAHFWGDSCSSLNSMVKHFNTYISLKDYAFSGV